MRDHSETHLLQYHRIRRQYLKQLKIRVEQNAIYPVVQIESFSGPWDPQGYADGSITNDLITDLYIDFGERTRKEESDTYTNSLSGQSGV